MKYIFLALIFIYQKFISVLSFGSCRFYPTCSQYAKISIKHNKLPKAIFYSLKRILKCNQFFAGGIDHPIIDSSIIKKDIFTFKQNTFDINNIQAWLVYTNETKQELYWISNFTKRDKI